MEHKTPEYQAMSPTGKVPAIKHIREGKPDLHVFESHAIMKYICAAKSLPDHWYPTSEQRDIYMQARIDQYLDWHH